MSRWDPFSEALSLRDAMNRLFEQAVWHPAFDGGQRSDGGFSPALDVRETSDEYTVDASLPGVDPKDVNIELEQGVLTIQGEIHEERQQQEPQSGAQGRNGGQGQTQGQTAQRPGRYHLRERRFGRFFRSITLPSAINTDRAEANFHNGVLTLRIPKAEEMKPRRIQIQTGGASQRTGAQIETTATPSGGSTSRPRQSPPDA